MYKFFICIPLFCIFLFLLATLSFCAPQQPRQHALQHPTPSHPLFLIGIVSPLFLYALPIS